MRADNIGIHETHHAGRHPPPLPDARSGRRRAHFTAPRLRASPLEKAPYSPPRRHRRSRVSRPLLQTENKHPTPIGSPSSAAAMLSSVRVGYRPAGSLKTYPFGLFRTGLMSRNVTRNRKKPLWLHLPKLEGEPWTNTKSKTKRTQFDPLFSIKDQNESQIPPRLKTNAQRQSVWQVSAAMLHQSEWAAGPPDL